MENYDNIIPIGYICNITKMLKNTNNRKTAYPFDSMAIPAWAVEELIDNDFTDLLDPSNMDRIPLFEGSTKEYVVDKEYYIRLPLREPIGYKFDKYKAGLTVKTNRLLEKLQSTTESTLFVRVQEPNNYTDLGDRIILPAHSDKYANDELFYLRKLSATLKSKYPSLTFKILFMNTTEGDFVDVSNNIVGINVPFCDYRGHTVGRDMTECVALKNDYMNANL